MAHDPAAPELVVIGGDPLEVQLLPAVGARLHGIRAFGHDLLRTPATVATHRTDPFFWGGYVMAPWANRVAPGPVTVGRRTVDLPPNFPDGTAIHGQVAAVPWSRRADGALTVRGGGDGWPWAYEVVQGVTVTGPRVRLDLELTNLADDDMPAGLGLHPWFRGPLEVAVAASRAVVNIDPKAEIEPVEGRTDLRTRGPVPTGLDATWIDAGDHPVELRWPELGLEATLEFSSEGRVCLALASHDGATAVALEPQTHAPWGLARYLAGDPYGLRRLPPGETLRLSVEMTVRRSS